MDRITIDNTDACVSRISFGTASLHHLFGAKQRQELLGAALDIGITHYDTAPYYGHGLSECDIGNFVEARRSHVSIATKVGLYAPGRPARSGLQVWSKKALGKIYRPYSRPEVDWSVDRARKSLENSLKRLKSDFVDFLFLHEPDAELAMTDEFLRWLEDAKSRGTIRYCGLAGLNKFLKPWLDAEHPLSAIMQTNDDIDGKPAEFMLKSGRKLQFTYGYLSSRPQHGRQQAAPETLKAALKRNNTGSILISTRRLEALQEISSIFS